VAAELVAQQQAFGKHDIGPATALDIEPNAISIAKAIITNFR
jgi:hypothetical protein